MKKVCVILVALLLLVGMSLSAEGKWTNWGEGILYPFYKVGDAAATAEWGPDWVSGGAYQEWNFAYDGDNYGYYAVWAFDGLLNNAGLTRWAAWYKPFDMLKLTLGQPRISDYRYATKLEGMGYTRLMNADEGMAVQIMPMEGLSIGAALYVDEAGGPLDIATHFGVGASYAFKDILSIRAQYLAMVEKFNLGVEVTAIEGVGLVAGYQADFSGADLVNEAFVSATVGMGPVNLKIDGALKAAADFDFAAVINGEFAIDRFALGASIGYDTAAILVGSGEGTPGAGFSLFPYAKANFPNDSYVKVGFVYASGNATTADVAIMAIPVLFVVAF